MTAEDRLKTACAKIHLMTDEFGGLLDLHANNSIITFSSGLAGQIPRSFAANSFNCIQKSLYYYEVIWICKFWDGVDYDKHNIPTVVELINDEKVHHLIDKTTRASNRCGSEVTSWEMEMSIALMQRVASRTAEGLRKAIESAHTIAGSSQYEAIKNLRDKSAHFLSTTSSERKKGTTHVMRYGDEEKLLHQTKEIIEALHLSITGNPIELESFLEIAKDNAEALWKNCRFNVVC